MRSAPDTIFRTLADPTRRAIFERLASDGEQTVRALTSQSGVSQPAVSKHPRLKLAGLVRDRTRAADPYSEPQASALIDWIASTALLARPVRRPRRPAEQDGSMTELTAARRAYPCRRTGDAASAGEDLARAHARPADRGMADEERFPAGGRPQVQFPRSADPRLERSDRLRGAGNRPARAPGLQLERIGRSGAGWPEDHRHLDAHAERRTERRSAWSSPASGRKTKPAIAAWAEAGRAYWEGWRKLPRDHSNTPRALP